MLLLAGTSFALSLTSPRAADTYGLFRDPIDYATAPAGLAPIAGREIHTQLSGEAYVGRFGAGYLGGSKLAVLAFAEGYVAGSAQTDVDSEAGAADTTGTTTTTTDTGGDTTSKVTTTRSIQAGGVTATVALGGPSGGGAWGVSASIGMDSESGSAEPDPDGPVELGGDVTTSDPEGIDTTGEYRENDRAIAVWGGYRTAGVEAGHAFHVGIREGRAASHMEGTWTDGTSTYSVAGYTTDAWYANHQQWGPAARWEGWFGQPGEARLRVDVEAGLLTGGFAETGFDERWAVGDDGANAIVTLGEDSSLNWDVTVLAAVDAPIGTARVAVGVSGRLDGSNESWVETTEDGSGTDTVSNEEAGFGWEIAIPAALEVPIGPLWTVRAGVRGEIDADRDTDISKSDGSTRRSESTDIDTYVAGRFGARFTPVPMVQVDASAGLSGRTSADTGESTDTGIASSSVIALTSLQIELVARF